MATILKYARIYREFIGNAFSEATSFRLHFVLLIVMDLLFYLSALASVDFIFDHVDHIGPWSREQFLFFTSFMLAVDHVHMTFISESFWNFSDDVRTGRLDFVLLKPVGAIFNVFFRSMRPASLCNFPVPWGCMFYFGWQAGLTWVDALIVPFGIVLALIFLVSVEILLSMSMFWIVESFGINFLRIQLQQMSRWPDFVYRNFARKIFTFFIPILLVGSAPVRYIFSRGDYAPLLLMFGSLFVVWFLIRMFWHLGLRNYESASS